MQIIHQMTIDMASRLPMPPVCAVQNDTNTRALKLTLTANSSPWNVPEGVTAAVAFRKPDGHKGLYDTLPDGTQAVTIEGNTVTAIFAPQVLTCPGEISVAVILTDDTLNQLATFPVSVRAERNPSAGLQLSNSYYSLQNFDQVNAAIGDLSQLQTADKSSLVAAINEAAKTGGSSSSAQNPVQGGADYTFLKGKKYYALGDSITEIQGTTADPKLFGNWYTYDLQGRDLTNITVSGYVQAIESRYGLVATNHGKSGHTLVGDYATIASLDYSDVALVTIAYGVNDARTGVPLGTVNSTDVSTFAGAMNVLLKKIYTDNPECRVLILAPLQRLTVTSFGIATPNANGDYLIDFVNMCKAIAEKRSTAFLDQYRCTGINQTNLYYYTVEGVHPVNQGFARIKNAVIGILDEQFALEYEPFGTMTNTNDTEPEEPETGGGSEEETPEEDVTGASIDLTDLFVYDGTIYDCYCQEPNLIGEDDYNASSNTVCTGPIALEVGKVYTLTTYWSSSGTVYIGLINGAESRGAYNDEGTWVANRVGSTTISSGNTVNSTVTIDDVEYTKRVYTHTPTKAEWWWVGSQRANMHMTTLTYV